MLFSEHFAYASLGRHTDAIGQVDPHSLVVHELPSGTTNAAWRLNFTVQGQPRDLVLRLPLVEPVNTDYLDKYLHEFWVRTTILPASFAYQPKPYYVDSGPTPHFVEAYIEGRNPPGEGRDWPPAAVAALGKTLAALRIATEKPLPTDTPQDAKQALLEHHHTLTERVLKLGSGSAAEQYLTELNSLALAKLESLAPTMRPGQTIALDHGDTLPTNMILTQGEKLFLIDWGDTLFSDPALSLAWSCAVPLPIHVPGEQHPAFTPEQQANLLGAYQVTTGVDEAFLERVQIWRAAIAAGLIVKMAGIIYNPDAPHRWKPRDIAKARREFELSIAATDYPQPGIGSPDRR